MIDAEILRRLQKTLVERKDAAPGSSYVASLYAKGADASAKRSLRKRRKPSWPPRMPIICIWCARWPTFVSQHDSADAVRRRGG